MRLKAWQKNILSIVVIVVGGFILFNLAFILTALVVRASMLVMKVPENIPPSYIGRYITVILILLMSYMVFRSGLNDTIKATFLLCHLWLFL